MPIMSSISAQATDLLNRARDVKTQGAKSVNLFGFRMRSTGSVSSATTAQVERLSQNGKVALGAIGQLDEFTASLKRLGDEAADGLKDAKVIYDAAFNDKSSTESRLAKANRNFSAAKRDLSNAQRDAEVAKTNLNIAQKELDANPTSEEAKKALAVADQALVSAAGGVASRKASLESASQDLDDATAQDVQATAQVNASLKAYQDANAEVEAVVKATGELGLVIPEVCEAIGRSMGLDNVFVHEYRFDKEKNTYTGDVLTFTQKSEALLRNWAANVESGVQVNAWERGQGVPVETINPLTRAYFNRTRTEDYTDRVTGKQMTRRIVLGDEALIASKLGALNTYRRILQSMMDAIIASATRRY